MPCSHESRTVQDLSQLPCRLPPEISPRITVYLDPSIPVCPAGEKISLSVRTSEPVPSLGTRTTPLMRLLVMVTPAAWTWSTEQLIVFAVIDVPMMVMLHEPV